MSARKSILGPVTIILEGREDGGLRVHSEQVRGLILSGADPEKVMADVLPALRVLLGYKNEVR